ncbi:MAG: B12-binding domain-containing radical SAM protein [Elusimicrobiales bacterium]|nr:B12-binding domain-containing radical SAM protein [Elusimicrobiales bacterium]
MTPLKILLIDPTTPYNDQMNLGLIYLGSYLDSRGYETRIVDMNFCKQDAYSRLDKVLVEFKPDIVGISIISYFAFDEIRRLIRKIKKETTSKIIVGGPSPSMFPEKMLLENKEIDFLIFGEGELTFAELLNSISGDHHNYSQINGLAYRKNNQVIINDRRAHIKDLDTLPLLNFDLVDLVSKYGFKFYDNVYTMATSRGCPYDCIFCLSNILCDRKWRPFSAKRVVAEIENAHKKYGLEMISFQDDNFLMLPKRVIDICQLIREKGLKIKLCLDGGIRADRLTDEALRELSLTGLERGILAVESGSPDIFNGINKGETLDEVEKTLIMLKAAGLNPQIFMILGLPGDTHETFLESLNFSKKHNVSCRWHLAFPFEGTQMYKYVEENGYFLRECGGYDIDIISNNDVTTPGTFPLTFDTPEYPAKQRLADYYYAVIDSNNIFYISEAKYKNRLLQILRCIFLVLRYHPKKMPF